MNFGILDKNRTFAMFMPTNVKCNRSRDFYILSLDVLSIIVKAIKLRWFTCFYTCKCSLARMEGDSLSLFINFKFHSPMPTDRNLKPGDNSTLTSTQPSEKGKSQSKLKKSGKDFEKSEKRFMFAVDSDQESTNTIRVSAFFMLLSDVSYLKNKLLKSRRIAVLDCMQLILGRIREASSFLYLPKFSLTFNSFCK